MGSGAAVSPAQPLESPPVPPSVGGCCRPRSVPSHEELVSVGFGIYTGCTKSLFFCLLVFDLLAFLLQVHVCVGGSAWAQGCSENTGRSGFGLPSPPSGLPREEKDGVFQHQTGRDSSGKKREVSSPSQEGSLLQKMPEGPLSGPAQEGRQWNPTGRTPPLWSLHHSTGAFAQPSPERFSLCPRKWPPERQTHVPTSAQLSASATLILKLPAESKVGGEGLGRGVGGCWALKAQDEGDQQ